MAGEEDYFGRESPIGERSTNAGGGGECGGDSGNYFEGHGCGVQGIDLFAGAAKEHGIADFEAYYTVTQSRVMNEQFVDVVLRDGFAAGALAYALDCCCRICKLQNFTGDQSVIEDAVGSL